MDTFERGRGRGHEGGRGRSRGRGRGGATGPVSRGGAPPVGPPPTPPAEIEGSRGRGRAMNHESGPRGSSGFTRGQIQRGGPPLVSLVSSEADTENTGRRGTPGRVHRGRPPRRGRGASQRGGAVIPAETPTNIPFITQGYGASGTPVDVLVNCFKMDIPVDMMHRYDVSILPEDKVLPLKVAIMIVQAMQEQNSAIFTKHGCFDGRKNLYSPIRYPIGDETRFRVNDPIQPNRWQVRIKWVAIINPLSAARYLEGKRLDHDDSSLMTINTCKAAIRMQPLRDHSYHGRSFFTRADYRAGGRGVELWRGYFQSVRPMIGKMVVNIDISSTAFYRPGSLISLCMEYLGHGSRADPVPFLSGHLLDEQTRQDLSRFIRGLSVRTMHSSTQRTQFIRDISQRGANAFGVQSGGGITSLQAYILQETGYTLQYPTLVCVQLSMTTWAPLECCEVPPDQFYRKTLTPDQTRRMIEFSTLRPNVRLQSIRNALQVLGYSNSTCLQEFGINVDPNPMTIKGCILPAPTLLYGRNISIRPPNGQWNMQDKTLYKPEKVLGAAVIIYDGRFNADEEAHLKRSLFEVSRMIGIQGMPHDPPVLRRDAVGGAYWNHLREVAMLHRSVKGNMPNLIIVVLPDNADDIYVRIKNAGDIKLGVATQCLKARKCGGGSQQYYSNVCLKINAKLGGINVALKPETTPILGDRAVPTLVMGVNITHPGPGQPGRPSYAAVVGNVDSEIAKYVAVTRAQTCRSEAVEDLGDMVSHIIRKFIQYRKDIELSADPIPKRIVLYRGGISEAQFRQLKEIEFPSIFRACDRIGIPRPKLTFVVLNKRHHIRFFPTPGGRSDSSGNVPAGLVVDCGITSSVEYDFYLQSHTGVNGTSRSTHYYVLLDENNFMPDDLQRFSFALCHLNARATRSTSIVSPYLYADMVTAKAIHHYDPDGAHQREDFWRTFPPVHPNSEKNMYFV